MTRADKQKIQKQLQEQRKKKRQAKRKERAHMSAYKMRWVRYKNKMRMRLKR